MWGETTAIVAGERLLEIVRWLHDDPSQHYGYLVGRDCRRVSRPGRAVRPSSGISVRSPYRRFLRLKVELPKGAPLEVGQRVVGVQRRRLARARVLRHVRHSLPRAPGPAAHSDVGAVPRRLPAPKGFPAARAVQPRGAASPGAGRESGSAVLNGGAVDRRRLRGPAAGDATAYPHPASRRGSRQPL